MNRFLLRLNEPATLQMKKYGGKTNYIKNITNIRSSTLNPNTESITVDNNCGFEIHRRSTMQ